jgi:hypothetical protein
MLLVEASHASANLKFVTNLMDSTRRESSPRGTIAELTRMQDNGTGHLQITNGLRLPEADDQLE